MQSKSNAVVTVEARDEKEALRQGSLRIRATGRVPPGVIVWVEDMKATVDPASSGSRIKTWEVRGTRILEEQAKHEGWLFYGWASS